MSEMVYSIGCICAAPKPITFEEREHLNQKWYDKESILRANYDGTLIYSEDRKYEFDGVFFGDDQEIQIDFLNACAELDIYPAKPTPYLCHWYNGSDSPLDTLTYDEWRNRSHPNT